MNMAFAPRAVTRGNRNAQVWLAWLGAVFAGALLAHAQTNSWTSPTSDNWEDLSWSLGVLPGPGQTIMLENHGWKAVAIGPNTALNFPQTLTIDALAVISPGTDTVNTLLLNYAGFQTPLVSSSLFVSNNARMVMLQSALQITNGTMTVGGSVVHDIGSQVTVGNLVLQSEGIYNLTDGTLTLPLRGQETIQGGQFLQAGGSNLCFCLYDVGEHNISGGNLVATGGGALLGGIEILGNMVQSGGTVSGQLSVGYTGQADGFYKLSGGILRCPVLQLPALGNGGQNPDTSSILQTGGTNLAGNVNVGSIVGLPPFPFDGGLGTYNLSNGVLVTSNLAVKGRGDFYQSGGTHSNSTTSITTTYIFIEQQPGADSYYYPHPGYYSLSGGDFVSGTVDLESGVFSQTGGSCRITSLQNNGGQYSFSKGQLTVSNLTLSTGAILDQSGGSIAQSGTLTLANAMLVTGTGSQQFGRLLLSEAGYGTNSTLTLSPGACVLHFANSSTMIWSNQPALMITNWSGSLSGGGNQQVIIGNDHTGLTSQQLSQIKFQNPAGVSPGLYPAVILANGEIIPDPTTTYSKVIAPLLNGSAQADGSMQLQLWGAAGRSYAIEISTNLANWTPWTNQFNTNGTFNVVDTNAANCLRRFYRAVLQP